DDDVAGHRRLAAPAPDPALDHRDDRRRMIFDGPDEAPQWIVPPQRVAMPGGQFADTVAGRPDLDARPGPQDDGAHPIPDEIFERLHDVVGQGRTERVALFEMVEADRADQALDFRFDERHGTLPPAALNLDSAAGARQRDTGAQAPSKNRLNAEEWFQA